ncbi:hypothetical protein [Sulfitobacter sp. 1A15106]|uniref:hypothetical protein n=1 Tax=Sulfitobacter sp. 1A15106 TaxID=3368590 RepID=UPI003744BA51
MFVKTKNDTVVAKLIDGGKKLQRSYYSAGSTIEVNSLEGADMIAEGIATATGAVFASAPVSVEVAPTAAAYIDSPLPAGAAGWLKNDGVGGLAWDPAGPGAVKSTLTPQTGNKFRHDDGLGNTVDFHGGPDVLTAVGYSYVSNELSYMDETGLITKIDLSHLSNDVRITSASLTSDILSLHDNSPMTGDVTVSLASLRATLTDNGDGTFNIDNGAGSSITIDTRADAASAPPPATGATGSAGVSPLKAREDHRHAAQTPSADAGNSITVGADGLHYLAETTTGLSFDGDKLLTYIDEDGVSSVLDISNVVKLNGATLPATSHVGAAGSSTEAARADHRHAAQAPSADAGNSIGMGGDGLHYFAESVTSLSLNAVTRQLQYVDELGVQKNIALPALTPAATKDTFTAISAATPAEVAGFSGGEMVLIQLSNGTLRRASVGDLRVTETVTTITFDPATSQLTFTDEAGVANAIDLSSLA